MNFYISFTLVLVGITQISATCYQNTICVEDRDTISQLSREVPRSELDARGLGSRAWYIQPRKQSFDVIMAFKNFSSTVDITMMVIAYTSPSKSSTQYFYGQLGNFEIVIRNVIGVMVFTPLSVNKTIDFVLNYYTGCEILTSAQDQITYFQTNGIGITKKTCWLIQPTDNAERRRIYLSARDVSLHENQSVAIWDVHTSQLIDTIKNGEEHRMMGVQADEYPFIMVDLLCSERECETDSTSFFVSYYAMSNVDVSCMNAQRLCVENPLSPKCNVSCPSFMGMIGEEYALEASQPITRSGSSRHNVNTPKPRNCPFPPHLCLCPTKVSKRVFCDQRIRCFEMKGCTYACIYYRVTYCLVIKKLSFTLL